MAPFNEPKAVIQNFKEKIESVLVQGNKLHIGTALGNIHVFSLDESEERDQAGHATFVECHKGISKKPIEQLGYIKDVDSLVVLADAVVTTFQMPSLGSPKQLLQTKGALCFTVNSCVVYLQPDGREKDGAKESKTGIPTLLTHLAVGCRRKIVIFSWKDGEALEVKELNLPHTPRAIAFFNHKSIIMAYTATEHVLLSIPHMSITPIDISAVAAPSTSALSVGGAIGNIGNIGNLGRRGMGNLGGYIGLGATARKPVLVNIDNEVLVPRDERSIIVNEEGKPATAAMFDTIEWPAPSEETVFVKPYIVSLFPPNVVPLPVSTTSSPPQQPSNTTAATLQVRSVLHPTINVQTLVYPFATPASGSPTPSNSQPVHAVRLLSQVNSSVLFTSSPTDKNALTAEGHTIWSTQLKSWGEQVDELVDAGRYEEALRLLDIVDRAVLPDKDSRVHLAKTLLALSKFSAGYFHEAITSFQELDTNPALVVSLYPEIISGRLGTPQDDWIELFGGKKKERPPPKELVEELTSSDTKDEHLDAAASHERDDKHGAKSGWKATLDSLLPTSGSSVGIGRKDEATRRKEKTDKLREEIKKTTDDRLKKSIEALLEYLPDRRQKVLALRSPPSHPAQASKGNKPTTADASDAPLPSLSSVPIEELISLPSIPPSQLTTSQLTTYAQIIDTALFKAFLVNRPGLIGPLCRIGNWCEVGEVEALLRARDKYHDLVSLYNGKKMHREALELLKELSANEDDVDEKLDPSISYLQKLGPEHVEVVFEFSRWILQESEEKGFQIFTSDDVVLPRDAVTDYLESINPLLAIRFIRFKIKEHSDIDPTFHDRLGFLLLNTANTASKSGNPEIATARYQELLEFISSTNTYRADRLFASLPSDGMFEARAVLLGRLGRHESALDIYVNRLKDYVKAEQYCVSVYSPQGETKSIFLSLLKIYLRPQQLIAPSSGGVQALFSKAPNAPTILLQPALELISRHSPRLDANSTLELLPPLVTAQDVSQFLVEVLRAPKFHTLVTKEIYKTRDQQLSEKLMQLQGQRVRITPSRVCPECHKRIGKVLLRCTSRGEKLLTTNVEKRSLSNSSKRMHWRLELPKRWRLSLTLSFQSLYIFALSSQDGLLTEFS